jgi:hypothetical protein
MHYSYSYEPRKWHFVSAERDRIRDDSCFHDPFVDTPILNCYIQATNCVARFGAVFAEGSSVTMSEDGSHPGSGEPCRLA